MKQSADAAVATERYAVRSTSDVPTAGMATRPSPVGAGLLAALLAVLVLVFAHAVWNWRIGSIGYHPDEPAHVVAGLAVRDYLHACCSESPMAYMSRYYDSYPMISIGVWPPLFYGIEAVWVDLFGSSRDSLLFLECTLIAGIAGVVAAIMRGFLPLLLAVAAGLAAIIVPISLRNAGWVGVDPLVTILSLIALGAYGSYLGAPRRWPAIVFGTFAGLALLAKGSAGALALVPAGALLVSGRWSLMRRLDFWIPVPIVLAMAGPWYWVTTKVSSDAFYGSTGIAYTIQAMQALGAQFPIQLTWGAMALFVVGAIAVVRMPDRDARARYAPFLVWPAAVFLFHSVVPANFEERYLIPAYTGMAMTAALGAAALARFIGARLSRTDIVQPTALVALLAAYVSALPRMTDMPLPTNGYVGDAAERFIGTFPRGTRALVSSTARQEGAFIAEVALRDTSRPGYELARGTKVLSRSDWHGRGYLTLYGDSTNLGRALDSLAIDVIAFDESIGTEESLFAHHGHLRHLVATRGDVWCRMAPGGTTTFGRGPFNYYRRCVPLSGSRPPLRQRTRSF